MTKIGFVLLHYNNIEVTRTAISCLLKLANFNIDMSIVVVDNASPNGTGAVLEEEYKQNPIINVILNNENLGFSKGNNIGYAFLRNSEKYEYIIVMNTDVFITDRDFLKKLLSLKHDVHVIGPDILTQKKEHQNPLRLEPMSSKELNNLYLYNYQMSKIYRIPLVGSLVMTFLEKRNDAIVRVNKAYYDKEMKDVVLHGACIIYSANWIAKEEFAFVPETFMYVEEDILMEYICKKGYHTLFCPELQVNHMEDASLNGSFHSRLKKRQFLADNMSASTKVLMKMRSSKVRDK